MLHFFSFSYCSCRVNVSCGQAEERVLLTGLHAVADIYCECCKTPLGWKYVRFKIVDLLETIEYIFLVYFPFLYYHWKIKLHTGTCLWVESKIQRRQIYYRIGTHDQRKWMGLIVWLNQKWKKCQQRKKNHVRFRISIKCEEGKTKIHLGLSHTIL